MRPWARSALATGATALFVLGSAAQALGQEPGGEWTGTALTTPEVAADTAQALTASISNSAYNPQLDRIGFDLNLEAHNVNPAIPGCVASLGEHVPYPLTFSPGLPGPWPVSRPVSFPCNGTYDVVLKVCRFLKTDPGSACSSASAPALSYAEHRQAMTIAAPGPPVEDLTVNKADDGRKVELSWTAPEAPPDGLAGYRIERKVGNGEYAEVVTLDDAEATSYTDTSIPEGGGELTYQVQTLRDSPIGPVASSSTSAESVSFDPLPGAEPTPDTAAPAGGSGSADAAARRVAGLLNLPRVGPSRVDLPVLDTPTTTDTGFDETLPFDEPEPGEEDPVLPGDELASLTYERDGRGLLVPAAAALVLALWAAHLRYLARLAKQ